VDKGLGLRGRIGSIFWGVRRVLLSILLCVLLLAFGKGSAQAVALDGLTAMLLKQSGHLLEYLHKRRYNGSIIKEEESLVTGIDIECVYVVVIAIVIC